MEMITEVRNRMIRIYHTKIPLIIDLTKAGESVWIDFMNTDAHTWYAFLFQYKSFPGTTETIAGFCHDANEPSFLNETTERTFPPETLHYDQIQNREVHNLYSLMHVSKLKYCKYFSISIRNL